MAPRKTSALSACVLCFIISRPFFVKGTDYCRSKPGKGLCSSTETMFCHPDQHLQIVEAYFVNDPDYKVCGTNCTALQIADGAFGQCLASPTETGRQCAQRLSYVDLVVVYKNCVRPLSRNCTFGDFSNLLSLNSTFKVHYHCIQENSIIDPCLAFEEQRSNASLWLPYNTSCHSVCEITPNDTKRLVFFKYQLIETLTRSDETMVSENNITFEITFTPNTQNGSEWGQFHSSYYDDYKQWQGVDKIRIRFNIPRGDVVRLLWISINDIAKITCRPTVTDTSSPTTGRNSNTRSGSANTASSTPDSVTSIPVDQMTSATESGEEGGFSLNTTHVLIVGVAVGAVLASIAAVGVCVVLRKRGRSFVRPLPRRQLERAPSGGLNPSHPGPRVGNPETGSRLYDEIREDLEDNLDAEVNSLPVAPRPPGPASQSNISQRQREPGTQAFVQSAVRVLYPPTGNSGYVDMSGTTQADEGLDAHSYVNTEVEEASVDADLIARPVVRAHQANETPAEYIELLP